MSIPVYKSPNFKINQWVDCAKNGYVQVGGYSNGEIPWPRIKKTGRHALILCDDLIKAVEKESVEFICQNWGVGATTVWAWRQVLGVDRITDGTRELLKERTGVPSEAAAKGREKALSHESRAKIGDAHRGKKINDKTRAALLKAAKAPKSKEWGKRANEWMLNAKIKNK